MGPVLPEQVRRLPQDLYLGFKLADALLGLGQFCAFGAFQSVAFASVDLVLVDPLVQCARAGVPPACGGMPSSTAAVVMGLPARTRATARARNSVGNGLGMIKASQDKPDLHSTWGSRRVGQVTREQRSTQPLDVAGS